MTTQPFEFSIGEIQAYVLFDFSQDHLPEELIVNPDREELERIAQEYGFDPDQISVGYHNLLLRTPQHNILVDAGVPQPYGELGQGLASLQIAPEEIDTIIITHSDMDHIAGILDEDDQVVYPNARYLMLDGSWEFWSSAAKRTELAALNNWSERNAQRAAEIYDCIGGSVHAVRPGEEFLPGLRLFAAPGHRYDHSILQATNSGQDLLHAADALVHPLFISQTTWSSTYDAEPAQAVKTKLELLERCALESPLVFAAHFPFPGLGHIQKHGSGWIWQPVS